MCSMRSKVQMIKTGFKMYAKLTGTDYACQRKVIAHNLWLILFIEWRIVVMARYFEWHPISLCNFQM